VAQPTDRGGSGLGLVKGCVGGVGDDRGYRVEIADVLGGDAGFLGAGQRVGVGGAAGERYVSARASSPPPLARGEPWRIERRAPMTS
jgi:hypothetical protein